MADGLEPLEVRLTADERDYIRSMRKVAARTKATANIIGDATDNIEKHWRDASGRLRDVRGRFVKNVDKMGDETEGLHRRVRRVTRGVVRLFGRMTGAIGRMARGLTRVLVPAMGIATAGLAALGAATIGFSVKAIQMASRTEDLQGALEVITGSAEKAEKTLKSLGALDTTTPLAASEINDIAKSLLAFGTPAEDVVDEIRNIGDVALILGQNVNEVAQIYGKAKVQGRLFAEDINQFTGRGIPIYEELQKVVKETGKVTRTELREMVSEGEVSFKHLQQAFQNMTAEGGRFHDGMAKAAQSTSGRFAALRNHLSLTMRDIGQVLVKEFSIKDAVSNLADQAGQARDDIVDAFREIVALVKDMGKAINEEFELFGEGFDLGENLEDADEAVSKFRKSFMPLFRQVLPKVRKFVDRVVEGFQSFLGVLEKLWPTIKIVTQTLWAQSKPLLEWIKANPKLAAGLISVFFAVKKTQLVLGGFGTSIGGVIGSVNSLGTALGDKRGVARSLKTVGVRSRGARRILGKMASSMALMFGPAGAAAAGAAALLLLAQHMQSWGKATKSTNEILRDTNDIIREQIGLAKQKAGQSDQPIEVLKRQRALMDKELIKAQQTVNRIKGSFGIESLFGIDTARGVELKDAQNRIKQLKKAAAELTKEIETAEAEEQRVFDRKFEKATQPLKDALEAALSEGAFENAMIDGATKAGGILEDAAQKSKKALDVIGLGGILETLGPQEAPKPGDDEATQKRTEKRLANAMAKGSSEALSVLNKAAKRDLEKEALASNKRQEEHGRQIAKNTKGLNKQRPTVFSIA